MNNTTHTFQPRLVALEGREVPSATATVLGNKLAIQADNAGSVISITDDGLGHVSASVTSAGGTVSTKGSNVTQIAVTGGEGNDRVYFALAGTLKTALKMDMDLGAGNDHASMDFYRGISNSAVNVNVRAGVGNDSVESIYGTMTDAAVSYKASLGTGNDASSVTLFNGLSGNSKATFDVAGDTGADRVDFNVMGKIDAAAALKLHAENSTDANDRVTIRYRGELDGTLTANVDKAASWYGVQSKFTLDAASTGSLTAVVRDATGAYGSTLTVTDHTAGPVASDIDRLDHYLSEMTGTNVTHFDPSAI
ncbi:MAG: hypothetical protein ACJ8F7_01450 [Gemmataceae bacterium]